MKRSAILLFILLAIIPTLPAAEETAQSGAASALPGSAAVPAPAGRFSRFLDLQTGTLAARYKRSAASEAPWIYQVQYQFLVRGRLKFDQGGRYSARFRLSTGKTFSYSWNATGAGDGDFATNIYLKELFFSASPWKTIEIQFGGIGINRGESTEITSYSNNGYLMGERVSVRRPDKLFFDEISATGAYLGDPAQPGVFQRVERLAKMNYRQFLVSKKINERFSFSAEYTFNDGSETMRQAIKVYPNRNRILDSVLFENYQRLDFHPAWGLAVTLQKNPTRRLSLSGGYVDIDRYSTVWNADKLGRGKRLFLMGGYNFWREFTVTFFAGKAFANDFPVINAARYDCALVYDFLKALKRSGIL